MPTRLPTRLPIWRSLPPDERGDLARAAGRALREGGLVILPTDTVYGVAASAASPVGLQRLTHAVEAAAADAPSRPGPRFTWHAAAVDDVRRALALPTAVHRRLLARLLPGPVRFVIEQTPEQVERLRRETGCLPGAFEAGGWVAVRVPNDEAAAAVLAEAGVPVVAERLAAAGWAAAGDAGGRIGLLGDDATDRGLAEVVDDGPREPATPSTTVQIALSGAFEVAPGGRVPEADVLAALNRTVLFVCTGNTCRSPMAAAIARAALEQRPADGIATRVESAGIAAAEGEPASPEAVTALREMGIEATQHRSHRLSRAAIRQADVIFTMTPSHREAVLAIDPSADGKTLPLDPHGPVPDPVGMSLDVYRATAKRMADLIAQRLRELEP